MTVATGRAWTTERERMLRFVYRVAVGCLTDPAAATSRTERLFERHPALLASPDLDNERTRAGVVRALVDQLPEHAARWRTAVIRAVYQDRRSSQSATQQRLWDMLVTRCGRPADLTTDTVLDPRLIQAQIRDVLSVIDLFTRHLPA